MVKQALRVAFAFIGVVVGAGFTTGQEIVQYFVALGINGVWGAAPSAVIMSLMTMIILELGSRFQATEHGEVFRHVLYPILSRVLDIGVIITLFTAEFVIFAGVSVDMEQQWGLPVWTGTVITVLVTAVAGSLNVDRVTTVIGSITLSVIGFILLASIYTLTFTDTTPATEQAAAVVEVPTALSSQAVTTANYVSFNLMVAAFMAIVTGGSLFNPRAAGVGGFTGSLIYSAVLLITTITPFHTVGTVATDVVSMLIVINHLHPRLGQAMAMVIPSMIFSTASGMFYTLGRRIAAKHPEKLKTAYVGLVLLGSALSFMGFQNLIGRVYPILSYIGPLFITVMLAAWLRGRERISEETSRRKRTFRLVRRGRKKEIREGTEDSNLSVGETREAIEE